MIIYYDKIGRDECRYDAVEYDDNSDSGSSSSTDGPGGGGGSVVKCLTRNPGVLGSSRIRSSGFFRGSVLR